MRNRLTTGFLVAVSLCALGAWGLAGAAAGHQAKPKKTVLKVGRGGPGKKLGTITSDPAGIDCGKTCKHTFDAGTKVTLTAGAGTGAVFKKWTGACKGNGACVVTLTKSRTVGALFDVTCVAPDVVGKTWGKARALISHAHCKAKRVWAFSDTVKKGVVISQDPAAGTVLPKGSKVTVNVSKGKQKG